LFPFILNIQEVGDKVRKLFRSRRQIEVYLLLAHHLQQYLQIGAEELTRFIGMFKQCVLRFGSIFIDFYHT